MKLTALKLFTAIFLFVGLADVAIYYNIQQFFLRQILGFSALLIIPGLLLNLSLRIKNISFFEYLLYAIGGSLSLIMLTGLGINSLPSLIPGYYPLSFINIFTSFNILTGILFIIAVLRNLKLLYTVNLPKIKKIQILHNTFLISLPTIKNKVISFAINLPTFSRTHAFRYTIPFSLPFLNNKKITFTANLLKFKKIQSFRYATLLSLPIPKNINISFSLSLPKINIVKLLLYSVLILLPILSILGAVTLNNGGSNILTMSMLGIAAFYIGYITFFKKYVTQYFYPFSLFMVSLSILLMLSFRSWHISGFDISLEYQVFQITKNHLHWALEYFKNEYNTCLSITILPTYLSSMLNINDTYIYKLLFQIIFAFTPVTIFYFVKKLNQKNMVAFLAGLFYMCTPWFIDPMTTLNRQEIAFFFFSLILLLLFEKNLGSFRKYILLGLMTIGLVVSHYSSTYITVILFTLVYLLGLFINIFRWIRFRSFKRGVPIYISFFYLIFLIGITFTWFSLINQSTKNLSDVSTKTFENLPNIFNSNLRTSIIDQIFSAKKEPISEKTYQEYYEIRTKEYSDKTRFATYSPDKYSDYKITPKTSQQIPVSNKTTFSVINNIYKYALLFIQIFLFLGTIYLPFTKQGRAIGLNFILFMLVSELLLGLIIILPYISIGYNFDRLYMQMMFILTLVQVIGGIIFLTLMTRNKEISAKILAVFYIMIFLYTYGFIWQLAGGKTVMWLNNFGHYYNQTYTQTSDYLAATWMKQIPSNPRIYSTSHGRNMLAAYALKNHVRTDVFPSTIEQYAYVFVTSVNLKQEISSFHYRGEHFEYEYPLDFLNENKNLIYSNGGSEVYK